MGAVYGAHGDRWGERTVSVLSSVLNSKLSFIVNDNNVSDGDDDGGGDDNLPN